MSLLLDTRVLLWWLSDDARLPERTRAAVADGENEVLAGRRDHDPLPQIRCP